MPVRKQSGVLHRRKIRTQLCEKSFVEKWLPKRECEKVRINKRLIVCLSISGKIYLTTKKLKNIVDGEIFNRTKSEHFSDYNNEKVMRKKKLL